MDLIRFPDPHPDNLSAALSRIGPDDRVVDVGGWWKPLNRADHVVDLLPYETRAGGGRLGHGPERYDTSTWHQFDIWTRHGLSTKSHSTSPSAARLWRTFATRSRCAVS